MKAKKSWMIILVCLVFQSTMTMGFEIPTHRAISDQAIAPGNSKIDSLLKAFWFEFENGIDQVVDSNLTVRALIQDGAENEDFCLIRSRHHFHNPRLSWDQAGWRPPPFSIQLGESSVIWSQDQNQMLGGKHSWKDARDNYYKL
jgi:hypothetical protein